MELVEPKFLREGYGYYDNDGLKVKEDAPEWAKKEYSEFMNAIITDEIGIEDIDEEDEVVY
ncbi:hypothetical protein H7E67_02245 [Clostridium gasigenes]|uniref:hypothetical protein n=1 Tax=Clostridium gasigenes TaxID=94869 RepID=UPI001623EEEC|nr:hypothetical protein [Clostridium gasigenes]MBB6622241.1 hypothetical protein [Clostridium gasigenes]